MIHTHVVLLDLRLTNLRSLGHRNSYVSFLETMGPGERRVKTHDTIDTIAPLPSTTFPREASAKRGSRKSDRARGPSPVRQAGAIRCPSVSLRTAG